MTSTPLLAESVRKQYVISLNDADVEKIKRLCTKYNCTFDDLIKRLINNVG